MKKISQSTAKLTYLHFIVAFCPTGKNSQNQLERKTH